jgi:hypothetical protein
MQALGFVCEMALLNCNWADAGGGGELRGARAALPPGNLGMLPPLGPKGASSGAWRADIRKESVLPRENDLEGQQDQGGKHGGQAGMPKSPEPPKKTDRDHDVARKDKKQGPTR